jgi:NADH-quinone oxidoreductase subunit D
MNVEKVLNVEVPKKSAIPSCYVMEMASNYRSYYCNFYFGSRHWCIHRIFYVFQFREKIYEIYEEICGARLTTNMGRIGGLNAIGHPKP